MMVPKKIPFLRKIGGLNIFILAMTMARDAEGGSGVFPEITNRYQNATNSLEHDVVGFPVILSSHGGPLQNFAGAKPS